MGTMLPTVEDLEKLPLRAVVAYAARTARRLSSELSGIVADEVLDRALRMVEAVSTTDLIEEVDKAAVICAAEQVTAAYADAPANLKSLERFRIVFSLTHAAEAAMFALLAANDPASADRWMKHAAKEAQRAVAPIAVLNRRDIILMTEAARQDYYTLLRNYGEHEKVIIGESVHCFDKK